MNGLACRLIFDPPASGAWNMAVDDVLLDAAADGRPTLRFYTWQIATLSLGYFQCWEACAAYARGTGLPVVRRPSGGGAILHGTDLTYALALPLEPPSRRPIRPLYTSIHQALVHALRRWGVAASLATCETRDAAKHRSLLCLANVSEGDVLVRDIKVAGSAQRRRGGAVLQHGSVLLQPAQLAAGLAHTAGLQPDGAALDLQAAGLAGISGLGGPVLHAMALARAWAECIGDVLGLRLEPACLERSEQQAARRLECERYLAPGWTCRR